MKPLLIVLICLLGTPWAFAKRPPPKPVEPVLIGALEFSAPNTNGCRGIISIRDTLAGTAKEVILYRIWISPLLEEDVQWDFVKSLSVSKDKYLVLKTEKGRTYIYNPNDPLPRKKRK